MRNDQLVELEVYVIAKTERAVLVTDSDKKDATWLPLAQVELTPSEKKAVYTLSVPEWLAQDRGLI